MAVNDVYRLTAEWAEGANPRHVFNMFYFKQKTILVFDTAGEDLVQAFRAQCGTAYADLVTNQLQIVSYRVGKAPGFETEHQEEGSFETGTGTGDALPSTVGGLLALKTATLSRRGRGRIYLPPYVEAGNNIDGRPSTTYFSGMGDFATALESMATHISAFYAQYELQVWSRADQVARPVTSIVVRNFWASQRDRRGALG